MKRNIVALFTILFMIQVALVANAQAKKLVVGVTLHPYYSWVKNIGQDRIEVRPILSPDADPHSYQPRPSDLANLADIDVIVTNGLGHDSFIDPMLKSAGKEGIKKIVTSKGLALLPIHGASTTPSKTAYNSHTYLSIINSVQQIYAIANELGKLDPPNAQFYKDNAKAYSKRLRKMLGRALAKINQADTSSLKIATVHDGYAYLMQELGLTIAAVIQPRHGIEPNPRQLKDTINQIKNAGVNVLFVEVDYAKKYVDIIQKETGCRIYKLSHVSVGDYSANLYERKMQENIDIIVKAVMNE